MNRYTYPPYMRLPTPPYQAVGGAPRTTNTEAFWVFGVAAVIAILLFFFTRKSSSVPPAKKPVAVSQKVKVPMRPEENPATRPAQWHLGGAAPGWTSGRYLGGGDFRHFWETEHPFRDQPTHAGHPMTL